MLGIIIDMAWFYYAAGSVAFFTSLLLLQRVIAVDSRNQRAMAVIFNFVAGLFAILIFFITGTYRYFQLPGNITAWISLLVASLAYAIYERGRFHVAKLLDASIFTIISNVSVLVAFVGSLFLYSEPLSFHKLTGTALIILALTLVSYTNIRSKSHIPLRGLVLAVAISTALGLGWMLDKMGATYFNPDSYNILIWTVPIIFIYFPHIDFKIIKAEFQIASWRVVVLAIVNVIGYLLQLKALQLQEATRVIPIVQTSTLLTVLLGILILKEKQHIFRKIFAGALAVLGVYLLM